MSGGASSTSDRFAKIGGAARAGRRCFPSWQRFLVALIGLCFFAPVALAQRPADDAGVVVDAETDVVIQGGLKWLASVQSANGSWALGESGKPQNAVAMTGYCLMTFMSTGNLPDEGPYGRNVAAGAQFLLDSVQPDGLFRGVSGDKYMYNHGIATAALSELYGQTRAPAMRPKLERLVSVIVAAQSKEGGWRYQPRAADADISVTVLQVTALHSALNSGIAVPQSTIEKAIAYVRSCQHPASGGFTYQAHGGSPGFARTAAAIYSLQVCGIHDDPMIKAGADYLFAKQDERGSYWTYGNYYAGPAQYMIGGDYWRRWYAHMREVLLKSVKRTGDQASWDLKLDGQGISPIYCTAVYTMVLAMPYHYLPLYQR